MKQAIIMSYFKMFSTYPNQQNFSESHQIRGQEQGRNAKL